MFTGITINLTAPICSCKEQNLWWHVPYIENKPTLKIGCFTCGTSLHVGTEQFKAGFSFLTPYAGVAKTPPPLPLPKPTPDAVDAKVVHLFGKKEK